MTNDEWLLEMSANGRLSEWLAEEHGLIDELSEVNMNLAHDLGECMAERDEYRDKLGRAVDMAHEIVRLMDEGLA